MCVRVCVKKRETEDEVPSNAMSALDIKAKCL